MGTSTPSDGDHVDVCGWRCNRDESTGRVGPGVPSTLDMEFIVGEVLSETVQPVNFGTMLPSELEVVVVVVESGIGSVVAKVVPT